ncbi:MAG TPA: helix-turn-helix transcriptional regulator [Acetobacteraceae bacterium]|jgi:phage repressor protein C with HTH and peptisase S24 domain|nr:helix-turn-helix transcriptional regulator [Acetobacteraceae bacterium]
MSRVREPEPQNPESLSAEGASRAAFTARLQVILRQWPSADRLARAMGVSPSAFRKWLRGEAEPSRERLVALADAAKVGIAWLAKGEGPGPSAGLSDNSDRRARSADKTRVAEADDFILLPKRLEAAAAGTGNPAPATLDTEYIAFRQDWVRSILGIDPAHLILETAVGESMQPTIRDGDLLLVDTTDRAVASFGVYVLEVGGERLVKRVQRKLDGSLVLISDNETYQPDLVSGNMLQTVTVVGRVVWGGGAI